MAAPLRKRIERTARSALVRAALWLLSFLPLRSGGALERGHVVQVVEVPFDADPADHEAEVIRLTAACSAALEAASHPAQPARVGLDA